MTNSKRNIKFTVIIPTRERVGTLEWSLKTCTSQKYENFEILVSDNFSQDGTRHLIESIDDQRIRYLNTGKRVSMTSNYEFALRHTTGEYVCIIGDDDGLMPNALHKLNELLNENDIEAVTWKKPFYFWNRWHQTERRNTLHLDLKIESKKFDAHEMLHKLFSFDADQNLHFSELASLYHGFIKTETINKLRSKDGQFFHSSIPDVYASMAINSTIKSYWRSAQPLTMHGISQHSTGFPSKNVDSMRTFLAEEDIEPHHKIKVAPNSASICAAECLLQVQKHINGAKQFGFDAKKLIEIATKEATPLSPEIYRSIIDSVDYIGQTFDIADYAKKLIHENPNTTAQSVEFAGYDPVRNHLVLRMDDRKVRNVYDATLICQNVIDGKSKFFYLTEILRYLTKFALNFGFVNSVRKGYKRIFYTPKTVS